jgi:hypothetical protein
MFAWVDPNAANRSSPEPTACGSESGIGIDDSSLKNAVGVVCAFGRQLAPGRGAYAAGAVTVEETFSSHGVCDARCNGAAADAEP